MASTVYPAASTGAETYSIAVSYATTSANATANITIPAGTYSYQMVPSGMSVNIGGTLFGNSSVGAIVIPTGATSATVSNYASPWAASTAFGTSAMNGISYGAGLFVMGGAGGAMFSSPDGATWTTRTSAFGTTAINSIAYGNGIFLAAGSNSTASTSTDGITWTLRTTGYSAGNITSVAYGPQGFITVTGNSAGARITTDGVTWNSVNHNFGIQSMYATAYGNGLYLIGGQGAQPYNITTATDGVNYTSRSVPDNSGSGINGLTYGNGLYIGTVATTNWIVTSTDGITWTSRSVGYNSTMKAAAYGNGVYVLTTSNVLVVSTNGINWVTRASAVANVINALVFGGTGFVGCCNSATATYSSMPTALAILTKVSSAVQAS